MGRKSYENDVPKFSGDTGRTCNLGPQDDYSSRGRYGGPCVATACATVTGTRAHKGRGVCVCLFGLVGWLVVFHGIWKFPG